jgi:hypothetical protein
MTEQEQRICAATPANPSDLTSTSDDGPDVRNVDLPARLLAQSAMGTEPRRTVCVLRGREE